MKFLFEIFFNFSTYGLVTHTTQSCPRSSILVLLGGGEVMAMGRTDSGTTIDDEFGVIAKLPVQ